MTQTIKFANRSIEIAKFREFAAPQDPCKRVIFFRAAKSSGASEFLRYLASNQDKAGISIYMDMAAGGVSQLADLLKESRDQRFLCRVGNFLQAGPLASLAARLLTVWTTTLLPLPRAGATALIGIGEGIVVTPFPSSSTSRICKMALSWPKPELYFFLDNAQKKATEIIQLARACAADEHYAHIRFVLAITDELEGEMPYASFRQRLPFGASAIEEETFQPIDARFVAAISAIRGLDFQHDDCDNLARLAGNDMWLLQGYLDGSQQAADAGKLAPMAQFVIRLLCVADQPLRRSDMRLLVLRSEQIVGTPAEFEAAIDALQRLRLVAATAAEDGDSLIVLTNNSATPVRELKKRDVANLAVLRDLYDFFCEAEQIKSARHSDAALAQLLYRLAHDVDPAAVPVRAQALVRIAMSQGSIADAERYIEIAQRRQEIPTLHDLFVQIALFVSLQDFTRAKAVLDRIPRGEFERYRILRILDAVALNRVRDHGESDRQINTLLSDGASDEEKALLVSYKIGGLLHEERWAEATEVLDAWAAPLVHAANYPYFLRNAAAVHMLKPGQDLQAAERMLDQALRAFVTNQDAFGEATTLCNLGVVKAYAGELESAERHFRQSYRRLSILGTEHIQESGTNLGTALMLLGQFDRARQHMMKLLPMMEMNYPRVITETNLAMLDMLHEPRSAAVEKIRRLITACDNIKIPDCVRHVRLAGALIEHVAGHVARSTSLLNEAESRAGATPELLRIRQATAGGNLAASEAFKLYRQDWMQYWSQNPLQMLPAATLTAQAELHRVAQNV
jgi:tetratricopeptide (TPR) repeat protein